MRQILAASCCCAALLTAVPTARADEPARTFTWTDDAPRGDGRRTMARFVPNLGRNFVGVFSRESVTPFLIGAAGAAASGPLLDGGTKGFFGSDRRFTFLGDNGQVAGQATIVAPVAAMLLLGGRFSSDQQFRSTTYDVAQALAVTTAWTYALKKGLPRTRPDASDRLAFPSGHTSNAFAWATVVDHHYGHRLGIPAYGVAGLIGASRLEKNKHHLSDVIAGAAIGAIVGRTVVRENGEAVGRQRQLTLGPATDLQGRGVGLSMNLSF